MGLFKKKAPAVQPKEDIREVIFEQHFTQSRSFKGCKRFNVSYYGYQAAAKGLAAFKAAGSDLTDADILLRGIRRSDYEFVDVIVNGFLLGSVTVWGDDASADFLHNILFAGKVEKAHIKIDFETIITDTASMQREKIYLFLK